MTRPLALIAVAFAAGLGLLVCAGGRAGLPAAATQDTSGLQWTVVVDPEDPQVGDQVTISVSYRWPSGPPLAIDTLSLSQPDPPVLQVVTHYTHRTEWTLRAVRQGGATFQVRGRYEKQLPCPTPQRSCPPSARYEFSPTVVVVVRRAPPPTPPPKPLPGDVDCSGAVTSIDALLLIQYRAALLASLPCPKLADLDYDCYASAVDAALILQIIAGVLLQPPYLPC